MQTTEVPSPYLGLEDEREDVGGGRYHDPLLSHLPSADHTQIQPPRRRRSIRITVRKTRSGSRLINAQRDCRAASCGPIGSSSGNPNHNSWRSPDPNGDSSPNLHSHGSYYQGGSSTRSGPSSPQLYSSPLWADSQSGGAGGASAAQRSGILHSPPTARAAGSFTSFVQMPHPSLHQALLPPSMRDHATGGSGGPNGTTSATVTSGNNNSSSAYVVMVNSSPALNSSSRRRNMSSGALPRRNNSCQPLGSSYPRTQATPYSALFSPPAVQRASTAAGLTHSGEAALPAGHETAMTAAGESSGHGADRGRQSFWQKPGSTPRLRSYTVHGGMVSNISPPPVVSSGQSAVSVSAVSRSGGRGAIVPATLPCVSTTPLPTTSSVHRSGSSDMVNGLNSSTDSVRCGSCSGTVGGGRSGAGGGGGGGAASLQGVGRYSSNMGGSWGEETTAPSRSPPYTPRYGTESNNEEEQQQQQSTIDALRGGNLRVYRRTRLPSRNPRQQAGNGSVGASATASSKGAPSTAIERWRAQQQRAQPEASSAGALSSLTAPPPSHQSVFNSHQWRDAFQRLEENKIVWEPRRYIGRGTSGKVYEGILATGELVAVKVLEVGVPLLPLSHSGDADEVVMSPSQCKAMLVLLREVEMMEKLQHRNIVTCIRCQVTRMRDRYLEIQMQQQQSSTSPQNSFGRVTSNDYSPEKQNLSLVKGKHQQGNNSGGGSASGKALRVPVQVEIVMELCSGGTLSALVRRAPRGQLPVVEARRYIRDVLEGLAYLHKHRFIHRDVKGENVLISAKGEAKLADFGCSRRIVGMNAATADIGGASDAASSIGNATATRHTTITTTTTTDASPVEYQWFDSTGVAQTMVGTPMFMAPEIIQASGAPSSSVSLQVPDSSSSGSTESRGYTASADIWSFGCLILEVFGRTPWPVAGHNAYHLMKLIEQSVGDLPPGVPSDTPVALLEVLQKCFHRDPQRRASARSLLRMPWMTCPDAALQEMPLKHH